MSNYKIETQCVQAGYTPKNGEPRVLGILLGLVIYNNDDKKCVCVCVCFRGRISISFSFM